jgi:hypothetical protein
MYVVVYLKSSSFRMSALFPTYFSLRHLCVLSCVLLTLVLYFLYSSSCYILTCYSVRTELRYSSVKLLCNRIKMQRNDMDSYSRVLSSNVNWIFLWHPLVPPGNCRDSVWIRILLFPQSPVQFIVPLSFNYSTLRSLSANSVVKWSRKQEVLGRKYRLQSESECETCITASPNPVGFVTIFHCL